ncbi:protein kinase domain-containing protein [Gloeothece verrucosa]|uniref:Serine/threonine-protein kinase-like domain protein n=1 Tax=Gloeothece verrucosa (strain PCC 7822) TaxID=497965 RepID=E0UJE2_GLOV7|nr:protein kinase [Gloeothece verrucosa]ADN16960.1 Serine/threonine-protein kinase-like domain protein [Gloeothece verrucosa PCC 7822]
MSQLLKPGDLIDSENLKSRGKVEKFLGGGTQGEVYQIDIEGKKMALKWYFPQWIQHDIRQKERLRKAIDFGAPNDRFLWPMDLAFCSGSNSYGYIMPLRESRFKGIVDLMKRQVEPTFRSLATAGFELADSYYQLHSKGLCYRDIAFGNVFFDPDSGEIRICDNDNVDVNGTPGAVDGTPRFMAPEIVRGEAAPTTQTDLFSLAILLFYMLFVHHPLEGAREQAIHCFDFLAMQKLYGIEPIFIFDPDDTSNRPVAGVQDNPIAFWSIYPQFLKDIFIKAFTDGIRDPEQGRVRESEWRNAMIRLRDSIFYCPYCGAENFYDVEALKHNKRLNYCWSCDEDLLIPPRIRIGRNVVILNYDTQLFAHHVDQQRCYDFLNPVAEVNRHPRNPHLWGLKNLSEQCWTVTMADKTVQQVKPGFSVSLAMGTKINFGSTYGEIRA